MTIREFPRRPNGEAERLTTDLERIARDLEKLVGTTLACAALLAGILFVLVLRLLGVGG